MAVRTVWQGDAPAQVPHYYGTYSEIVAITGPEGAIGHPTDSVEVLEYEGGRWGTQGASSKAPGSPSAPFTSTTERDAWAAANLASLLPGRTTAWVGDPAVEHVWVGPGAGSGNWLIKPKVGVTSGAMSFLSVGDSITHYYGGIGGLLAFLSNGKLAQAYRAGFPGSTLANMKTNAKLCIEDAKCKVVRFQLNTNDAGITLTPASTAKFIADYKELINCAYANGAQYVYLAAIPPRNDSHNIDVAKINFIGQYLADLYGAPFVDPWVNLRSNSGASWAVGASIDGIHPTVVTAIAAAATELTLLPFLSNVQDRPSCISYPTFAGDGYTNPLFLLDTNGDGVADGVSLSGGMVGTLVAGDLGNKQRLTYTNVSGNAFALIGSVNVVPGDVLEMAADINHAPGGTNSSLLLKVFGSGNFFNRSFYSHDSIAHYLGESASATATGIPSGKYAFPAIAGRVHWRAAATAAGTVQLLVMVNPADGVTPISGVVDVSKVTIRNLTALGLA